MTQQQFFQLLQTISILGLLSVCSVLWHKNQNTQLELDLVKDQLELQHHLTDTAIAVAQLMSDIALKR